MASTLTGFQQAASRTPPRGNAYRARGRRRTFHHENARSRAHCFTHTGSPEASRPGAGTGAPARAKPPARGRVPPRARASQARARARARTHQVDTPVDPGEGNGRNCVEPEARRGRHVVPRGLPPPPAPRLCRSAAAGSPGQRERTMRAEGGSQRVSRRKPPAQRGLKGLACPFACSER